MFRTLALSAAAALGMMLLPGQVATTSAAPAIAPKIATPESAVEQVRRRGGRHFRGGRHYGARHYRGGRHYSHRGYRHRGWRRGVVIGAGIPFVYGGYHYSRGCGYYHRKWRHTGSRYWLRKYRACRYY